MATQTPNLNLTKPMGTDYVRIGDFNDNADKLDASIGDLGQLTTDAKASLVLAINEAATKGGANAPYIGENGNWWQWDATTAQYVDTNIQAHGEPGADGATGSEGPPNTLSIGSVVSGASAAATITGISPSQTLNLVLPKGDTGTGLDILGTYATLEALEAAVPTPAQGDMYNIGSEAPYHVYMWDTTEPPSAWKDQGSLQGPPGQDGAQGQDGKSGVFYGSVADAPEDAEMVVDPAGGAFTTDNVPEGEANKYYTDERVDGRLAQYKIGTTANLPVFTGEGGAVGTKTASEAIAALGAAKAPVTQTVTLLSANWTAAGAGYYQIVDLVGMRSTLIIAVSPDPDNFYGYTEANIYCSIQSYDALAFNAKSLPSDDITVNILILG